MFSDLYPFFFYRHISTQFDILRLIAARKCPWIS